MNMNAAGIDVSSRKSTVAVLRPFGEVIKLPFDVRRSAEELASLAEQLSFSFIMVSTTSFLNSGVYRLFGFPRDIINHPIY